jgi:hypothetical protein
MKKYRPAYSPLPAALVVQHLWFSASVLLWLFSAPSATAQPPIGVKLGAGLATAHFETISNSYYAEVSAKSKVGLMFGVFTQLPVKSLWVFQPGVQYAFKGYRLYRRSVDNFEFTSREVLPYLEAPLNFLHASRPNGTGFLIGGGPVVGLLVARGYRSSNPVDVGLNLKTGYRIPVGFSLNLDYTYGFSNLKNRFLALTVGYLF